VVVEALRMRAAPEGSHGRLLEFLKLYRDAVQMVVNELWGLDGKLSREKLYEVFYNKLRGLGL
jgi:putative transposase